MNRNVNSHFSQVPRSEIPRSRFDRSASVKTSLDVGELIPFCVEEILPGDTFEITTSKVIRAQTMLTPAMDSCWADFYWFFVPNRLVWDHWKEFCGENTSGAWAPQIDYTIPSIIPPEGGFASGTLADYLGLPVGVEWSGTDALAPSALPFRGYALICNEFFRDQNLTDPLLIPTDDANQQGTNGTGNYISDVANGGLPFIVAKAHDYFTSALPSPQKGDPVGIPIDVPGFSGGSFPVGTSVNSVLPTSAYPMSLAIVPGSAASVPAAELSTWEQAGSLGAYSNPNGTNLTETFISSSGTMYNPIIPTNLVANIPDQGDSGAQQVSFSVNELRLAFAYQRYLEKLARGGSRYIELIKSLFGVSSPDARLQRPEYLGGNRVPININEVTNSAQSEKDFLGDLGAKSNTGNVHRDFIKSFTEHGYLFGLMCIRYEHSYSQGLHKHWMRKTFTDFYNPTFANLGEMPIYQAEIYANDNFDKSKIFGYQEAWAEMRYRPNMVTGLMRPNVANSLAHWHMGDDYESQPFLSDEWIREDKNTFDRVLAVTSDVSDQFWCDIYIQNWATRCMPMYSVPGLIDHY